MRYTRPIGITCLSLALAGFSTFCSAQSTAAAPAPATNGSVAPSASAPVATAPIQITSHGDQLEVKVPDQAPLSTVMSSLCQQQKLKCTGTETLTTYHGPAMSVEGTLRQVIAKLVEGTDINYEFSRSAEGGATAIAFLGHAPKGTAAVPTAEQPAAPVMRPMHSRPFPGNVPPGTDSSPQPPPGPQSELMQPEAVPTTEAQPTMANNPPTGLLPFPDTRGNVASVANTTPTYLPFPDAHGNLIPVTNTTPTMLPFPDQFGNPIPVKPSPGGSPFPMNPSTPNTGGTTQQ